MTLPKIILIDDETRGMDSYFQELKLVFKDKYEVTFVNDVDLAYEFLQKYHDKIKLVILDVMMPPGKLLGDVDTDDGLRTGVRFHQKIRNILPQIPIIIFTNFSSEELEDKINQCEQSKFLNKADYLPFELADEIKEFLGYNIHSFCD